MKIISPSDSYELEGRGTVYVAERKLHDFKLDLLGECVIINEQKYKVIGVEKHCIEVKDPQIVGLLVKRLNRQNN